MSYHLELVEFRIVFVKTNRYHHNWLFQAGGKNSTKSWIALLTRKVNIISFYKMKKIVKCKLRTVYRIALKLNILTLNFFLAVHTMLNDLLPDHIYFRFNPYLTEMLSMVEIRPEKIGQMEQDARMYIRRNEDKFQKAAVTLLEKRQIQQKIADWVTLQKQLFGL